MLMRTLNTLNRRAATRVSAASIKPGAGTSDGAKEDTAKASTAGLISWSSFWMTAAKEVRLAADREPRPACGTAQPCRPYLLRFSAKGVNHVLAGEVGQHLRMCCTVSQTVSIAVQVGYRVNSGRTRRAIGTSESDPEPTSDQWPDCKHRSHNLWLARHASAATLTLGSRAERLR